MQDKKQLFGIVAALTANIIFGFSFIFSKYGLAYASPLTILTVRFTIAFLGLSLLVITGKCKVNFKGKPKFRLIIMGMAQPVLYFIFEFYGLSLVSSALSGVIISLVPVIVMVLAVFVLKEKPTPLQLICTILSISGTACISIISNDGSKNFLLGIILLIAAVFCAAVFNILSKKEAVRFSPFERTYIMSFLGFISFNVLSIITLRDNYFETFANAFKHSQFIVAVIYLSLASSVLAFLLYNYSTSVISVLQTSSFSNIVTVVTVLAGVLILKEEFSIVEYILCVIIILGVWGVNTFVRKKDK